MVDICYQDRDYIINNIDNVAILKLLEENGYVIDANWWGSDTPVQGGLFYDALCAIFGTEKVQEFARDEEDNDKKAIADFMGCPIAIDTDSFFYDHMPIIAAKSDILNSDVAEQVDHKLNSHDDLNPDGPEIMLIKTGFLIIFSECFYFSCVIKEILDALNIVTGHIPENTDSSLPAAPDIQIRIWPEVAEVEAVSPAGIKTEKKLHPSELIQLFASHSTVTSFKHPEPINNTTSSGLLPHNPETVSTLFVNESESIEFIPEHEPNSISYGTKTKGKVKTVGIMVPTGIYPYNYNGEIFDIPFPQMLFVFSIAQKRIGHCQLFALKRGRVNKDTVLYRFPFGNVGHNGSICFGRNKLPEIESLAELETFYMFVLGLEHNDDDYWNEGQQQREVLESLKGSFDQELLVETNLTIKNLIKEED